MLNKKQKLLTELKKEALKTYGDNIYIKLEKTPPKIKGTILNANNDQYLFIFNKSMPIYQIKKLNHDFIKLIKTNKLDNLAFYHSTKGCKEVI